METDRYRGSVLLENLDGLCDVDLGDADCVPEFDILETIIAGRVW
jgi:hypothetical protein